MSTSPTSPSPRGSSQRGNVAQRQPTVHAASCSVDDWGHAATRTLKAYNRGRLLVAIPGWAVSLACFPVGVEGGATLIDRWTAGWRTGGEAGLFTLPGLGISLVESVSQMLVMCTFMVGFPLLYQAHGRRQGLANAVRHLCKVEQIPFSNWAAEMLARALETFATGFLVGKTGLNVAVRNAYARLGEDSSLPRPLRSVFIQVVRRVDVSTILARAPQPEATDHAATVRAIDAIVAKQIELVVAPSRVPLIVTVVTHALLTAVAWCASAGVL